MDPSHDHCASLLLAKRRYLAQCLPWCLVLVAMPWLTPLGQWNIFLCAQTRQFHPPTSLDKLGRYLQAGSTSRSRVFSVRKSWHNDVGASQTRPCKSRTSRTPVFIRSCMAKRDNVPSVVFSSMAYKLLQAPLMVENWTWTEKLNISSSLRVLRKATADAAGDNGRCWSASS